MLYMAESLPFVQRRADRTDNPGGMKRMSDTVQNGVTADDKKNDKKNDKMNDAVKAAMNEGVVQNDNVQDGSYNIEENNSLGKVQIADDVVAIIAGLAAGEVEGVYRLPGSISDEFASKLGRKNPAKGVKVELLPGKVKVELSIEVLYEYSIPSVSGQVQDKVKQAIETMTGLSVEQVNIRIAGVRVGDSK